MAHLQAFMSDLISRYECSSIYVVSDNARRIPQQQAASSQQRGAAAPLGPVSPRFVDYKRTTRWGSVEAIPTAMSPPVRQNSDGNVRPRQY